jgi:uncharacterized membrane protein YraQ (UPF0718 family)
MYILIIVGSLAVGILGGAIINELYKNSRTPFISDTLVPSSNDYSPLEIATQMVRSVRKGNFPKHVLKNKSPSFNDGEYLAQYKADIQNPSVIAHIQSVKGDPEHE